MNLKKYFTIAEGVVLLKSVVVLGFLGSFYIIYIDSFVPKTLLFFDLSIIVLCVFLGLKSTPQKVTFSDLVDILYTVAGRIFSLLCVFWIVLQIFFKIVAVDKSAFSAEQIGFHVLFLSLVFFVMQTAFSKK